MPYSGVTFTNVSGATTASPGQTVQSAVWDNIHTDYATALTMLMSQMTATNTNRNILWMNGGFEVWQRGAGNSASIPVGATTTQYTADRWYLTTGANEVSTVAAVTGLTNPSQLAGKVTRNNTQTGTTAYIFGYPLSLEEIGELHGYKVSFTASVKAGANWSPASGTLNVAFYVGTGAAAKRGGGFAGETTILTISTNLTAGGAVTTITGNSSVTVPTNATQAELQFTWTPVGTAGANDEITIDDVQLEAQTSPSTWTPTLYDRMDFSIMLAGCQRYFYKSFNYNVHATVSASYANSVQLLAPVANVSVGQTIQLPVRLRATASVTLFNPVVGNNSWQNLDTNVSVTSAIDPHATVGDMYVFISAVSVSAQGQTIAVHYTASAGL